MQWFPVVEKLYWGINLVAFHVGNTTFDFSDDAESKPRLIVDTGTTFYTAGGEIFQAIRESITTLRCEEMSQLPSWVYTLQDSSGTEINFTITPSEYMVKSGGLTEGYCFPAVVNTGSMGNRSMMILGEVFMRHYFTVFDWGSGESSEGARVGFATASYDNESEAVFSELE